MMGSLIFLVFIIVFICVGVIPGCRYIWGSIKNIFTNNEQPIKYFQLDKTYFVTLEKSEKKKIYYLKQINDNPNPLLLGDVSRNYYDISSVDVAPTLRDKIFHWDKIIFKVATKKLRRSELPEHIQY